MENSEMKGIKKKDKRNRYSTISAKGYNFCDFVFA